VLRIRIDFNADPDPAFSINAVRFRIQGFDDQKLKEKILWMKKFKYFFTKYGPDPDLDSELFKVGTGIEVSFHNTDDKEG
jgi:hypothetical protein